MCRRFAKQHSIMTDNIVEFLAVAWDAANAAGKIIRRSWQQSKTIDYKGAIDLVTTIDRETERKIVEVIQRSFSDHAILAEEDTNLPGNGKEYRWIIDPLDGTTNFAHSYPHFCVSIALECAGEVVLGLVYDPLRGECFKAVKGEGATLNGGPIRVSNVTELDKALLATGFPYDRREKADFYLSFFKGFMTRSQGIRRNGSAALDLCYVACGRIDGFWELQLRAWDTAASALIVEEAGGKVSDLSGNKFTIWGEETLASNGAIHGEMVSVATAAAKHAASLTEP
jgi:myo-inositol-1(or 4)-monophosphatase